MRNKRSLSQSAVTRPSKRRKTAPKIDCKEQVSHAWQLFQDNNLEQSFREVNSILQTTPNNHFALALRGHIRHKKNEYRLALGAFEAALRIEPNYLNALEWHGYISCKHKLFSQAIIDFNKYLQIRPDNNNVRFQRALAMRQTGKFFSEVLDDCNKVIELEPNYSPALALRGEIRRQQGMIDESVNDLIQALQIDPNNSMALANFAELKYLSGATEEALELFVKALQYDDTVEIAKIRILQAEQNFAEAILILEEHIKIQPCIANYKLLQELYLQNGQKVKSFEIAVNLHDFEKERQVPSLRDITRFFIVKNHSKVCAGYSNRPDILQHPKLLEALEENLIDKEVIAATREYQGIPIATADIFTYIKKSKEVSELRWGMGGMGTGCS